MIKSVDSAVFKEEVLESKRAILVEFYAPWCGYCKVIAPVLDKIADSRADFEIVKVNIDYCEDLALEYGIELVPTMVVFKDGKPVNQIVGDAKEEQIIDFMSEYID